MLAANVAQDTITDFQSGIGALHIDASLWNGALNQARLDALPDTTSGTLVPGFDNGDTLTLDGLGSNAGLLADILLV